MDSKDPYKVEMALKKLLPPEESNSFCHRLVLFGRDVCSARSPRCGAWPLAGRLSLQGQPCSFAGRRRIQPVSSQKNSDCP